MYEILLFQAEIVRKYQITCAMTLGLHRRQKNDIFMHMRKLTEKMCSPPWH